MRKILFIFLLTAISLGIYAQSEVGRFAPLNPKFVAYMSTYSDTSVHGFIPSPLVYSFDGLSSLRSAIELPAVYDMRTTGLLTSPRAQGLANTCWAFATMDAIQATWAKMGFSTTNYSVENLANCHGFLYNKNTGGTPTMAIAYLSRFGGPVYEDSDAYVYSTTGTCHSVTVADKAALVTQALELPQNVNLIKQMVYRYGGVFTGVSTGGLSTYYNSTTNTTYTPSDNTDSLDHSGTIVGWNDTMTVTIPGHSSPSNAGVWIVKGTYGTSKYDKGYYYASYEDYYVGQDATVYPQRMEKANVDTLYYYDKLGQTTSFGYYADSAYTLHKFTAPKKQIITAVGVYTTSAASVVDIEVYKQKKDSVTLTGLIASQKGLICEYPGYNSFDIKAAVDSGDFYVKVKYYTPGNLYPIPIEYAISNYASPTVQKSGLQWFKYTEKSKWLNAGSNVSGCNFNICLKVYAQNDTTHPLFSTAKKSYCLADTVVYRNNSSGNYTSYAWSFGDGATPSTATTTSVSDSVKVVYSTTGPKKVSLTATVGSIQDSIVKGNAVNIVNGVPLYLTNDATNDSILKHKTITFTAAGANSYTWLLPSDIKGATGDVLTYVVGDSSTLFKVTAAIGQCTTSDSTKITVWDHCASYDDIANAKTLTLDTKEGPFSNKCATWEDNEPHPEAAATCTSQTGWCPGEGDLHSTIWFKFAAPSTGAVKIVTSGFDDKIALYDAVSSGAYTDIISDDSTKYKILAANDDASDTVSASTIEKVTGLTSGKYYWLQLDGSYNGVTGSAYVTVSTQTSSGITETGAGSIIIVNPAKNGLLTMKNAASVTQVCVYDLAGKLLTQASYQSQNTINLNVSGFATGYYIVKLQTPTGTTSSKVLFE